MEHYVVLLVLLGTFSILLLLYGATATSHPESTTTRTIGVDLPTISFVLGIIGLIEFAKRLTSANADKKNKHDHDHSNDNQQIKPQKQQPIPLSPLQFVGDHILLPTTPQTPIRKDTIYYQSALERKQAVQLPTVFEDQTPEEAPKSDDVCGIPRQIFDADTAIKLMLEHFAGRVKALGAAIVDWKSGRTLIVAGVPQADGKNPILPPVPTSALQNLDYSSCIPQLVGNQFLACPNRYTGNVLVFIMSSDDQLNQKQALEFATKMKSQLMAFFSALTPSAGDKPGAKTSAVPPIDTATPAQMGILNNLADLFEAHLLKRSVGVPNEPGSECISVHDNWNPQGRNGFKEACWWYVCKNEPLVFALPAFPFKSGNRKQKVLTWLPDMGEKLSMQRLDRFLADIPDIYQPGGHLVIFSDGRVYGDLFRIPDEVTDAYKSHSDRRLALLELFGSDPKVVAERISYDPDYRIFYCGFKKFMSEELAISDMPLKKIRTHVTCVAKQLMQRTDAYAQFVRLLFPNCIRLSVHPSTNTKKFSINLIGDGDWGTPWHNCALQLPDGGWTVIKRQAAEEAGFQLAVSTDGLPYFIMSAPSQNCNEVQGSFLFPSNNLN